MTCRVIRQNLKSSLVSFKFPWLRDKKSLAEAKAISLTAPTKEQFPKQRQGQKSKVLFRDEIVKAEK
jgi:hypothetical protein